MVAWLSWGGLLRASPDRGWQPPPFPCFRAPVNCSKFGPNSLESQHFPLRRVASLMSSALRCVSALPSLAPDGFSASCSGSFFWGG